MDSYQPDSTQPDLAQLAQRMARQTRHYGSGEGVAPSPLYAFLSRQVTEDAQLLELLTGADPGQPVGNLLFAAVQFLLLGGVEHELREFYPGLSPQPRPLDAAYPAFRAFCLEHSLEIAELVATKRVQTNEVRRCATLLPAFVTAWQAAGQRPLALIEIGASVGFNLRWDHYGYDYGSAGRSGDAAAALQLHCNVLGPLVPPIPTHLPAVAWRAGIEIDPVDPFDSQATRWLRALIWPEHTDRAALFEQALAELQRDPPRILPGDAAERLPELLAQAPADTLLCVYHSFVINQCPPETRARINQHLAQTGLSRPLLEIALAWLQGQQQPHLELINHTGGQSERRTLAYCESHGRAIEWLV